MRAIIPFFIIIPALEIGLLMYFGKTLGIWLTISLILGTGFLGAYLAKKQGLQTMEKLKMDIQTGQYIGDAVIDGVCILVGGLLLLTPGFITDITGCLLLFPVTRKYFKPLVYKFFRRWFQGGSNIIIMK
ncbi:FxsA family protein [Bacillus sp. REN10]|uniref:FxsA family protein n=1 Tax=Bacillus sp. REN10 TaxID=2782541 RepID=UPI00193B68A3|nr:FxsA family protein [Bacillus sp. REN10]